MTFDWTSWAALARDDPEAFERRRLQEIEAVIAQARPEHQQRLRGLQFRIDAERRRSTSPLGACVRINKLMWESFGELRQSLQDLQGELEGTPRRRAPAPPQASQASAQVLPFRSAR